MDMDVKSNLISFEYIMYSNFEKGDITLSLDFICILPLKVAPGKFYYTVFFFSKKLFYFFTFIYFINASLIISSLVTGNILIKIVHCFVKCLSSFEFLEFMKTKFKRKTNKLQTGQCHTGIQVK